MSFAGYVILGFYGTLEFFLILIWVGEWRGGVGDGGNITLPPC